MVSCPDHLGESSGTVVWGMGSRRAGPGGRGHRQQADTATVCMMAGGLEPGSHRETVNCRDIDVVASRVHVQAVYGEKSVWDKLGVARSRTGWGHRGGVSPQRWAPEQTRRPGATQAGGPQLQEKPEKPRRVSSAVVGAGLLEDRKDSDP